LANLTTSSLIARNATLNLLGEGWVFLVLLVAMPKLIRFLGEASFGLFSLAWVIIGYLTVLDIGVSRAATKFISGHLANREFASVHQIVSTAIVANLGLGTVGGLTVALASPFLVHSVFKVGTGLEQQAKLAFYVAALAVPVLLLQGVFRGVLSSFQRFGWITAVNTIATTLQWGLACFLAWRGHSLALVVLSTVLVRTLATAAYGLVLKTVMPKGRLLRTPDFDHLSKLLRFGSWVTVSQVVGPLLVYLDRVLIASFNSLSAVALYIVPYEVMTRLRIIPSSLVTSLYPAFSERTHQDSRTQLETLYRQSIRYLLPLLLPGILILVILGSDLLEIWMGAAFAAQTTSALKILAFGVLANGMAFIPFNILQAVGRPDLTGKFHILELPAYLVLCLALIPHFGINGAAWASTFRFTLDAALLFWAVRKYCRFSLKRMWNRNLAGMLGLTTSLAAGLFVIRISLPTPWLRVAAASLATLIYFAVAWIAVVDSKEKLGLGSALKFSGNASES